MALDTEKLKGKFSEEAVEAMIDFVEEMPIYGMGYNSMKMLLSDFSSGNFNRDHTDGLYLDINCVNMVMKKIVAGIEETGFTQELPPEVFGMATIYHSLLTSFRKHVKNIYDSDEGFRKNIHSFYDHGDTLKHLLLCGID